MPAEECGALNRFQLRHHDILMRGVDYSLLRAVHLVSEDGGICHCARVIRCTPTAEDAVHLPNEDACRGRGGGDGATCTCQIRKGREEAGREEAGREDRGSC